MSGEFDPRTDMGRFRPDYRELTADEQGLIGEIKAKATEMEALFERVAPGRYRSLAMTSLEASVMWVVKEVTSQRA